MRLEIGLVFSTTGPYAALGRSALAGARMAAAEIREAGGIDLVARIRDPGGVPERYEAMADELLSGGIRHLVGAITSWSRKDMIPVLERHHGLLWYPCPYEGFEMSDRVVYLGASPNQHVVPLMARMAARGVRRAFLVGSNYVWGWETLRLARERIGAEGGTTLGERYLPLGDTDARHIVDEIADLAPDLIVNSLIGPSSAAFMAGLAARGVPTTIVSCNQTEADLADLGPAAEGMLTMGAWFAPRGPDPFLAAAARSAPGIPVSAFFATAYTAVHLLAGCVARAGSDATGPVFDALSAGWHQTVLGPLAVDPVTRHAALTPHLARVSGGRLDIVERGDGPVAADPYLSREAPRPRAARPSLRLVT